MTTPQYFVFRPNGRLIERADTAIRCQMVGLTMYVLASKLRLKNRTDVVGAIVDTMLMWHR